MTAVRAYLFAAYAVAAFVMPPQAAPAPTPAELARAIQQKYDTVRDFSASFEHRYRGGVLRKEAVERGTMEVKKPSRMRWTYESPERKVFVADGTRIYSYIPEDRQVIITPMPAEDEATTPALFLTGHGSLPRDFAASFPAEPDPSPGTYSLKLVPNRREAEYDWLVLVVDRGTYRLRKLITADTQGGQSTFTFSNVRENVGIPDSEFRFTIPRGVDVVTHEQPRR
ncbi:MAG: LolA family protein [Rhodospirillaceae bacterium]